MRCRRNLISLAILCWVFLPAITASAEDEKKADGRDQNAESGKEEAGEAKKNGPEFAFVCLNDDKVATEAAWRKSLKKWLALKSEDDIKEFELDEDPEAGRDKKATSWSVSFEVDQRMFVVGAIGARIPKPDIDYAVMNSFMWPEAKDAMGKHQAHLIVMAMGEYKTPCARALALSRVIAAATEIHDTAGVYWGHASTVHSPEMFRKFMDGAKETMGEVPSFLWVGFLREGGDKEGTVNLYTDGLEEFGAKEIEVINSKRKPSEIFEKISDLSAYLVMKGDVIKDGDTIGNTATEKIETKWADSHIGREGKVIRVTY